MTSAGVISGICWSIAYFCMVYRSFKDKSYAMPMAALALNFTWEFVYSFIFKAESAGIVYMIINTVWFLLDIGLVVALFKNGPKYMKEEYDMSKGTFYTAAIIAFALSFAVMYVGATFFAPFEYFHGDTFESAKFIAMFQNAVMSILFVNMFYTRRKNGHPIEGQSLYAALAKMVGTSFTVGITQITSHWPTGNWQFIAISEVTCVIFDIWYVVLLYKELRKQGINPFKRV